MGSYTNIDTPGPQGIEGKSAYQVWLEEGNIGTEEDFFDSLFQDTFETVSKNLKSYGNSFSYNLGELDSITYTVGVGTIVKTFNYTGNDLTSVVLSGDTPSGIDLTKTLNYITGELVSIAYS